MPQHILSEVFIACGRQVFTNFKDCYYQISQSIDFRKFPFLYFTTYNSITSYIVTFYSKSSTTFSPQKQYHPFSPSTTHQLKFQFINTRKSSILKTFIQTIPLIHYHGINYPSTKNQAQYGIYRRILGAAFSSDNLINPASIVSFIILDTTALFFSSTPNRSLNTAFATSISFT